MLGRYSEEAIKPMHMWKLGNHVNMMTFAHKYMSMQTSYHSLQAPLLVK